jgi:membrane protein DedA with SNARE-associated domain
MTLRTRKAFGTIGFVLWLITYSLIAMAFGGQFVVGSHMLVELGFYIVAVVPWLLGAMAIIRWMSKPEVS